MSEDRPISLQPFPSTNINGVEMSVPTKDYRQLFASNIPKYFLYVALKGFGFGLFLATWVIYLQERRGLSLSQAALIDATFFVAAAFGEIPTGIIADTLGRKKSLIAGAALLSLSIWGWTFAPTLPLILIAYVSMGIGLTFLSGAEDALFYESIQIAGRGNDYTRLVGRAGAVFPGALALGSVFGGFLASVELVLPFVTSGAVLLVMFGVVLTFREPRSEEPSEGQTRKPFLEILRQSIALMRARPTLRYPMFYIALIPIVSLMMEGVFLQPQAVLLGVPLAGIGLLQMGVQITNMAGSSLSDQVKARFGERWILYLAPLIIVGSLILLGALQIFPALVFIAVMSFLTAVLRPILLSRIQNEVSDNIRATVISMQSLMFTVVGAITQPTLGFIGDKAGLPTAYFVLAGALGIVMLSLLWISRHYFPKAVLSTEPQADLPTT
jgi:MFS family permease